MQNPTQNIDRVIFNMSRKSRTFYILKSFKINLIIKGNRLKNKNKF